MAAAFGRPVLALMMAALVLLGLTFVPTGPAAAQEAHDNRPFLLRLFGGAPKETPAVPKKGGSQVINVPEALKARPQSPAVVIQPKEEDARVVLVIGDKWAADLARGLDVAFADTPGMRFEVDVVDGGGLRDTAPRDWRGWLEERLAGSARVDAVVVMFGLADIGPIKLDSGDVAFPSVDWETIYRARLRALTALARARGLPMFWVGLVPVADASATNDLTYLDSIIREETQGNGVRYVDVWDAFSVGGVFAASGPDITGQVRQLRLNDGRGFTRSGSRRLAFFVEQDLKSFLSTPSRPNDLIARTASDGLVQLLNDPSTATEDDLLAAAQVTPPQPGTPIYRLVIEGLPNGPQPGRIDDLATP